MKKYHFILLCIAFMAFVLVGCETPNQTNTDTSSAQLASFYLSTDNTNSALKNVSFTIEQNPSAHPDTGLVYNPDSIAYGTSLEKVVPHFTFKSTIGQAIIQTADTTITLRGGDTINLSQPAYLHLTSIDGTTHKCYKIVAHVHSCDPDLYVWEKICDQIYDAQECEQGAVWWQKQMALFTHNGTAIQMSASEDGSNWSARTTVAGLPLHCNVRRIVSDGTCFYYGEGHHLYQSADGITWSKQEVGDSIVSTLMYWNGAVWVALSDAARIELATVEGGTIRRQGLYAPAEMWPVSQFAGVQFRSSNGRERALILGGYAPNGMVLNSRWHIEYSSATGNYHMENFANTYTGSTALTGASMVWYNDQLMLFGGKDQDYHYQGREIRISTDEGVRWSVADTAKNQLPETYSARYNQNVLTDGEYIYLIGGEDAHHHYSDVYRGKLNSISWNK